MSATKMPSSPSSASKGFSSTPLKSNGGKHVYRSASLEKDLVSSEDDTYSLLSPIYHDSFDSDLESDPEAQSPPLGPPDSPSSHREEAKPGSLDSCELPRKPIERALSVTMETPVSPSLSAWEQWLVAKARQDRLRLRQQAEEDHQRREAEERTEREQAIKKVLGQERILDWLKIKKEQERQEKQLRLSREQEKEQRHQEEQRRAQLRAQERYRDWLHRKNQQKAEEAQRAKEEAERKEEQESERRRRAEKKFKEWLASVKDKGRSIPRTPGYPGSPYDNAYPAPSFYNPIPWKPIHVPPTEKPPKKTPSRRKGSSQGPSRLRDRASSTQLVKWR